MKKLSVLKTGISEVITENVMKLNTEILHYERKSFVTQGWIVTIMYKCLIIKKEFHVFKTQICRRHRVVDCHMWHLPFSVKGLSDISQSLIALRQMTYL